MTIHVDAAELQSRLLELGERSRKGEEVVVVLDGEPVWILRPVDPDRTEALKALADIREARKSMPKVTIEEIIAWRDEDRKY